MIIKINNIFLISLPTTTCNERDVPCDFRVPEIRGAYTSEVYIMPRKVIFIAEKKELLAVEIESMDIVEA